MSTSLLKVINWSLNLSLDINSIEFFKAFYEEEGSSICLYYDANNFAPKFKNSVSNFFLVSNNVRSLGNNLVNINNLLDQLKVAGASPDLFAMQEIWNQPLDSLHILGYNLIAQPRTGGVRGGGVAII